MNRSDFAHVVPMVVRWGDMDAVGHVNNAVYFQYAESGRIAYYDTLLGDDPARWGGQGPILASIKCDYHAQVKYPADLEIGTRCSRLGGKSLTMVIGVFDTDTGEHVATLESVTVWFDYAAQTTIPVPDDLRQAIVDFERIAPESA